VEARPDCYSVDGVVPAPDAQDRQSPKCAICPHAVWGSRANMEGKGTACSVNTRAAVIDPEAIDPQGDKLEPYLLRIPAGSRSNFSDVVKAAEARNIPYNALVLKVGFDNEAPAPKLTFKLVGLLDDSLYARVDASYNDQTVEDMLGFRFAEVAPAAPPTEADADMARIVAEKQAREETERAAAAEAAAAAERARQAAARPVAAPQQAATDMSSLDAMMGTPTTPAPAVAQTPAVAPPAATATPAAAPAPRRRRTQAEMAAARAAAAAAPTPAVAVVTGSVAAPATAAVVTPPPPPAQPAAQPAAVAAAADHADLLGNLDALLEATDD
jgi:chemotaxis protein histidine kinase CheA